LVALWFQEAFRRRSVGGGSEGLHLDTADTLTIDGSDLDVTLVTPGGAPRVSDNVVVLTTLGSVTNGSDGVVELGTASSGVENTRVVHLEDALVSLDGDGNNTSVDGSLELGNGVSWNPGSSSNLDGTSSSHSSVANTRVSMSRGVWVGGLEGLWV